MSEKKCVFAGTFDPPTLGHKAVIEACLDIFDEVVVAFLVNPQKQPYFGLEARKEMLARTVKSERVRVVEFSGTIAELLEKENTDIYVRGLRNATDFDYETADFYASKKLNEKITPVNVCCGVLAVSNGGDLHPKRLYGRSRRCNFSFQGIRQGRMRRFLRQRLVLLVQGS